MSYSENFTYWQNEILQFKVLTEENKELFAKLNNLIFEHQDDNENLIYAILNSKRRISNVSWNLY